MSCTSVLNGVAVGAFEPTHEILTLFVLRKFILQIRMRSHPVGLDVFVGRLCDMR